MIFCLKSGKCCSLTEFEIVTLKSGIKSLRSLERGETFHPVTGPLVEANILHVNQQRLIERCAGVEKFVVWDVGFGAAANVLAAIEALKSSDQPIEIYSFDKTTSPIEFALSNSNELGYLNGYENILRRLIVEKNVKLQPQINWQLCLGDFGEAIQERRLPSPHAIFYDPYSPVGNLEMWVLEHFQKLRRCLDPNVPCLLTNYTRSTAVRATLILAGFYVGQGCEVGEKAETTIASNQFSLLRHPLDRRWLERVRNSTNAAPMRNLTYSKAPISQEDFALLQQSPQFCS